MREHEIKRRKLIGILVQLDETSDEEKEFLFPNEREAERFMEMVGSIPKDFSPIWADYNTAENAFDALITTLKK
jgi:hypothetical protein